MSKRLASTRKGGSRSDRFPSASRCGMRILLILRTYIKGEAGVGAGRPSGSVTPSGSKRGKVDPTPRYAQSPFNSTPLDTSHLRHSWEKRGSLQYSTLCQKLVS